MVWAQASRIWTLTLASVGVLVGTVAALYYGFGFSLERFILAHTPRFRRLLEAAARRIGRGKGLAHEEFWKAAARPRSRVRRTTPER